MLSIQTKCVLVAGGAGKVGAHIVQSFLSRGARVIVPSRSRERLDLLEQRMAGVASGELIPVWADLETAAGEQTLLNAIRAQDLALCGVVASLGSWWHGQPLLHVSPATWNSVLHNLLTSHFLLARLMLPVMQQQGSGAYTILNGAAAENPFPFASPVSVATAGLLMLGRSLIAEMGQSPVRINQLILGPIHTSTLHTPGRDSWLTGSDVGEIVAQLTTQSVKRSEIIRLTSRAEVPSVLADLAQ